MHSFHECPLRSSSLLIVNKEKNTIVTATDELLDMLGYSETSQLLGKSIDTLNPTKKDSLYLLEHKSTGFILFEICIHHDPLTSTDKLDYWLMRPVDTKLQQNMLGPPTILRLNTFGTIENAYPSFDFPQTNKQLFHQPIMSFVHESDVQALCHKISQTRYKTHCTLRIRWIDPRRPTDKNQFQWVLLTVMNAPRRLSCSSLDDLQSQPICVVQMLYETQEEMPRHWQALCIDVVHKAIDHVKKRGLELYQVLEIIHQALDQGHSYVVEYFTHVLNYLLGFAQELKYFYCSEMSTVHCIDYKTKNDTYCKRSSVPSVKVYDDMNTWTIPLLGKNFQFAHWTHHQKL